MSKKTRVFVVTAAAILAVGLTTGLVASYMGLPVAFSSAAGPEELEYVPAEAAVVAYANVREIMDSEFRERFRQFSGWIGLMDYSGNMIAGQDLR